MGRAVTAQITVVGNITRDPDLRFTASGLAVCGLGIAVNRKRGEEETTSFFDVSSFGDLAEHVAELPKGCRVIVVGRLEQRSWDKDGEKRSKVEIVADEIGPSLRWATAAVTKTGGTGSASGGSVGGGGARPDDGISRPGGRLARSVPVDEEPF